MGSDNSADIMVNDLKIEEIVPDLFQCREVLNLEKFDLIAKVNVKKQHV